MSITARSLEKCAVRRPEQGVSCAPVSWRCLPFRRLLQDAFRRAWTKQPLIYNQYFKMYVAYLAREVLEVSHLTYVYCTLAGKVQVEVTGCPTE